MFKFSKALELAYMFVANIYACKIHMKRHYFKYQAGIFQVGVENVWQV